MRVKVKKANDDSLDSEVAEKIIKGGFFDFEGMFDFDVMIPYVRQTHNSKFTDSRAIDYNARKKIIAGLVKGQMIINGFGDYISEKDFLDEPIIDVPYKIGFAIAPKKNKAGLLPDNTDFDNYIKAFLDALVSQGVVKGDTFRQFRGFVMIGDYLPCVLDLEPDSYEPTIYWRIVGESNF